MKDWRISVKPDIHFNINREELFHHTAKMFIELALAYQKDNGFFAATVGGGRTPIVLNQKIVELSKDYDVDWTKVFLFFSDERCVPKHHEYSNYNMVYETLAKPLSIPSQNVFRIQGELGAGAAADKYEKDIICFFSNYEKKVFDLALLGLGEDCHTASLFPEANALRVNHRLIVPGGKGKEGIDRVTMTYPIINSSSNIWFVFCGEEKRRAFNYILNGDYNPCQYPAQGVYCNNGNIVYFTDIDT